MLPFDQIDILADPIQRLYSDFGLSVVKYIAEQLKRGNIGSAAWAMQKVARSSATYETLLTRLTWLQSKNVEALRVLFSKAGVVSQEYDDILWEQAGFKTKPHPGLNLSPQALAILKANVIKTGGEMKNLGRTVALTGQDAFIKYGDIAHMQVISGAMDYDTAIKLAVKNMAAEGAQVVHYSGHKDQLDVAMRRLVLTGIGQTVGQLTINDMKERGWNTVEVSAHIGARNKGGIPENHEMWQGHLYTLDIVKDKMHLPEFVAGTGFGTGPGLLGWNCRHTFYPYFGGAGDQRNYDQKILDEYRNKKVTYNGRKMSWYEGTQIQRTIERNIRKTKREAYVLGESGLNNWSERQKIRRLQAQMRDFVKQTGIYRQNKREQIYEGKITNIGSEFIPKKPVSPQANLGQFITDSSPNSSAPNSSSGSGVFSTPWWTPHTPEGMLSSGEATDMLNEMEKNLKEAQEKAIKESNRKLKEAQQKLGTYQPKLFELPEIEPQAGDWKEINLETDTELLSKPLTEWEEANIIYHMENDSYKSTYGRGANAGHFQSGAIKYDHGGMAMMKPDPERAEGFTDNDKTLSRREALTYKLSKALGFNMIPPTIYKEQEKASMMWFLKDGIEGKHVRRDDINSTIENFTRVSQTLLLDILLGNPDRHYSNWMVDENGWFWAIDNGITFTAHSMSRIENRIEEHIKNIIEVMGWEPMRAANSFKYAVSDDTRMRLQELYDLGFFDHFFTSGVTSYDELENMKTNVETILDTWDDYFIDPENYKGATE